MTDDEIIRRCADKAGIKELFRDKWSQEWNYNPLRDGSDVMDLIRQFDMVIERESDGSFGVTIFTSGHKSGGRTHVVRQQKNLNRAICECVARLPTAPSQ